ncbi:unnamed protein product [Lupinus luteus]|uniref:DUF4283 domain-containing protein n=1 Tax=Lupinus luteus TaxID=3873 RepID=A0AAV1X6C6_LUPLU
MREKDRERGRVFVGQRYHQPIKEDGDFQKVVHRRPFDRLKRGRSKETLPRNRDRSWGNGRSWGNSQNRSFENRSAGFFRDTTDVSKEVRGGRGSTAALSSINRNQSKFFDSNLVANKHSHSWKDALLSYVGDKLVDQNKTDNPLHFMFPVEKENPLDNFLVGELNEWKDLPAIKESLFNEGLSSMNQIPVGGKNLLLSGDVDIVFAWSVEFFKILTKHAGEFVEVDEVTSSMERVDFGRVFIISFVHRVINMVQKLRLRLPSGRKKGLTFLNLRMVNGGRRWPEVAGGGQRWPEVALHDDDSSSAREEDDASIEVEKLLLVQNKDMGCCEDQRVGGSVTDFSHRVLPDGEVVAGDSGPCYTIWARVDPEAEKKIQNNGISFVRKKGDSFSDIDVWERERIRKGKNLDLGHCDNSGSCLSSGPSYCEPNLHIEKVFLLTQGDHVHSEVNRESKDGPPNVLKGFDDENHPFICLDGLGGNKATKMGNVSSNSFAQIYSHKLLDLSQHSSKSKKSKKLQSTSYFFPSARPRLSNFSAAKAV